MDAYNNKQCSIVILANSFNPSVFNQYWLVKNGFFNEGELTNSVFAPAITQILTTDLRINIISEKLDFVQNHEHIDFNEQLSKKLIPMISKLKEIPYKAIGINFNWDINITKENKKKYKSLFFVKGSNLYKDFDDNAGKFGAYMSKNFHKARLKLDIKPFFINQPENTGKDILRFSFNFHIDLGPNEASDDLLKSLDDWTIYNQEAERIIKII